MKTLTMIAVFTASLSPLAAQWLRHPTPGIPRTSDGKANLAALAPRTADGRPDLSGIWDTQRSVASPKLDAAEPWVQAVVQERRENYGKDNPKYRCLPEGPAYSTEQVASKQIIVTPAMIVMLNDDLTYRR